MTVCTAAAALGVPHVVAAVAIAPAAAVAGNWLQGWPIKARLECTGMTSQGRLHCVVFRLYFVNGRTMLRGLNCVAVAIYFQATIRHLRMHPELI
jgi:hypothetical protein